MFPLRLYITVGPYEIRIPIGARNFVLFPKRLNVLWRTSTSSSVDSGVISGVKQKGGEDGQSLPSSVEVQNVFMV
jgi:hypothetical protein